jgi:hypothetical protein
LKNNRTDFEKTMDMVIYNKADTKKIQTMQESKNDLFISQGIVPLKLYNPRPLFEAGKSSVNGVPDKICLDDSTA